MISSRTSARRPAPPRAETVEHEAVPTGQGRHTRRGPRSSTRTRRTWRRRPPGVCRLSHRTGTRTAPVRTPSVPGAAGEPERGAAEASARPRAEGMRTAPRAEPEPRPPAAERAEPARRTWSRSVPRAGAPSDARGMRAPGCCGSGHETRYAVDLGSPRGVVRASRPVAPPRPEAAGHGPVPQRTPRRRTPRAPARPRRLPGRASWRRPVAAARAPEPPLRAVARAPSARGSATPGRAPGSRSPPPSPRRSPIAPGGPMSLLAYET